MIYAVWSLLAIALAGATMAGQDRAAAPDRFAPIRFLAGAWKGEQSGRPGKGTVERTSDFILADRFLHEKNTSTYAQQEKNPKGEVHHHMSVIGYDQGRKRLVFRQFHVEGFVVTYVHEPGADATRVVFVSEAIENIPAGWRARETYTILSRDEFRERFELAEPGKDFELYSEAHIKRVR